MERVAVFDPTGKVKGWLEDGETVYVWKNVDMSSPSVGHNMFTRKPEKPHWAYTLDCEVSDVGAFLFYRKVSVVKRYTDTSVGWKAAERHMDTLETGAREAPIGTVHTDYTLERHQYNTADQVDMGKHTRPLDTHFDVCVVQWSAIDRR